MRLSTRFASCNPPKGIGVAATHFDLTRVLDEEEIALQSPEGDWCRCDLNCYAKRFDLPHRTPLQSPEGDWCRCDP